MTVGKDGKGECPVLLPGILPLMGTGLLNLEAFKTILAFCSLAFLNCSLPLAQPLCPIPHSQQESFL